MRAVIGFDAAVADFVAKGLGLDIHDIAPFTAIGFEIGGQLVAGVVYNNFRTHDIQLTAFSTDNRWLSKNSLRTIFSYPYIQLGCVRTTAVTGRANKRTRKLLQGLGYKLEGVHPKAVDGKQTAISYGMVREDCRWIT
ncbi:N-acetyltransferase [Agrobacterium pusense]|uniref:N-acetyltransferase n=1 Tax=Agrobacterium pusense TaxID=648995 RepID=UPI0010BF384A|nr:N-acetyltransferase [Agrobacterium pusense]QCL83912.1 N-acetyltransferase [Agrobacterium pusense]